MNCKTVYKDLPAYLNGELKSDAHFHVDAHLQICESCSKLIKEVETGLEFAFQDKIHETDAFFFNRLESKLTHEIIPDKRLSLLFIPINSLVIAATILIGVFIAYSSHTGYSSPSDTAVSVETIIAELSINDLDTPSSTYYNFENPE